MTENIRRLCLNYAHAMKWYIHPLDYQDDDWLREMIQRYMKIEALKNHYAGGSLELDEFEQCLDIKLGLKQVGAPVVPLPTAQGLNP